MHASDELTGTLNGYKRSELIASGGYFWSKLIKKSFIDRVGLEFREHCILEDFETLMYLFATADSIGNVKEILYCYKNYPTSISKCVNADSYYNNDSAAIEAIYNKLSSLPDYFKIQYAVEYSIYNLCALTLNTCLNLGQAAPASIQKQRLNTINYYLNSYIKLPITDNKYIQNKMSSKDINLINNIDSIISRIG